MYHAPRAEPLGQRQEVVRPALKLGGGELWKDQQLQDYWRANGLCLKCNVKFDPLIQCARKHPAELHAIHTKETPEQLSKEVLNMLELQDLAEAQ
jgi:hypothetical protein